jgi:hypothetical protein
MVSYTTVPHVRRGGGSGASPLVKFDFTLPPPPPPPPHTHTHTLRTPMQHYHFLCQLLHPHLSADTKEICKVEDRMPSLSQHCLVYIPLGERAGIASEQQSASLPGAAQLASQKHWPVGVVTLHSSLPIMEQLLFPASAQLVAAVIVI